MTRLETVGRQAIASLAFCSTAAQVTGIADDRWQRPTVFNGKLVNLSRVFRNAMSIDDQHIANQVRAALGSPGFNREVWIVAGRLLDVSARAQAGDLSNRLRQLLMFLESPNTACARANTRLRVLGH